MQGPFAVEISPDWEHFVNDIMRTQPVERVHFIELFLDYEVQMAICERFGLCAELKEDDPLRHAKRQVILQRFLGYDFVRCGLDGLKWSLRYSAAADTAALQKADGRQFVDESKGPITSWEEFEKYPWPDPAKAATTSLEWYQKNLPEDMCIVGSGGFAHFSEHLNWLMGYETLCVALYEQRDLVEAISKRLVEIYRAVVKTMLQFDRVKVIWGSDDMGFKTGPLISPADTREFVLPGHKLMAEMAHDAGRPYILHSCGKLDSIMGDLIDDVKIDGKHSFEDTIEHVTDAKKKYGTRISLLGGIDVDFLCRATEEQVRERVRKTLDACLPGGGYLLGTGNSVANYIPVDNYLAMLDEGRKYCV